MVFFCSETGLLQNILWYRGGGGGVDSWRNIHLISTYFCGIQEIVNKYFMYRAKTVYEKWEFSISSRWKRKVNESWFLVRKARVVVQGARVVVTVLWCWCWWVWFILAFRSCILCGGDWQITDTEMMFKERMNLG